MLDVKRNAVIFAGMIIGGIITLIVVGIFAYQASFDQYHQMRKEKLCVEEVFGFSNGTVIKYVVSVGLPATITVVILKDDVGVEIEVISSFNKEISGSGAMKPITVLFNPENLQVTHEYTVALSTERGGCWVSPKFKFTY